MFGFADPNDNIIDFAAPARVGTPTPGPWSRTELKHRNDKGEMLGFTHIKAAGGWEEIATVYGTTGTNGAEQTANARLMAAAPELLEALQDCAEALAFARERLGMCGEGDHKDRKADASDFGSLSALNAARAAINKATRSNCPTSSAEQTK